MTAVWKKIKTKDLHNQGKTYDLLACRHTVIVTASEAANTYRQFRACPICTAIAHGKERVKDNEEGT